jgi:hypothetical protein
MIKISDSLREIIKDNQFFQFALSHRLLNLSQFARYIKPVIEARTKKPVQDSAVLMNLSRLQSDLRKTLPEIVGLKLASINIFSDLFSMTFFKNSELHLFLNKIYFDVQNANGFITVSEGAGEITFICESRFRKMIEEKLPSKPKHFSDNLSGIGLRLFEDQLDSSGVIYYVLQQLFLQNINLVEISSTYTEFILYVKKEDTQLAFDTLFNTFSI